MNESISIKRVYIAGPLTPRGIKDSNPAIEYLTNVRDMIRVGVEALLAGFIPFIPALDMLLFLELRPGEKIPEDMIRQYSLEWLCTCDALILTPFSHTSHGTIKEVEYAQEHGIPVFSSLKELIDAVHNTGT